MKGTKTAKRAGPKEPGPVRAPIVLRLYTAGQSPRSFRAIANLRRICDQHLAGRCVIEVIDLTVTPELARGDQIVALPTLVRKIPLPIRKIIGDLSNVERVLVGLDIRQNGTAKDHSHGS